MKRALDLVASALGLLVLWPLFLVVAALVKAEDGGPVMFRQQRVGRNLKTFFILKFRTMRVDAAEKGPAITVAGDDRVTRVGRLLRPAKLDELPQLWNVLCGDMSLVGPRPDVPYAIADYAPWMQRRLAVTPGVTGLWQVSGRSRLSLLDMYRLDVEYAEHASLALDLSILFKTIPVVLTRDGAA